MIHENERAAFNAGVEAMRLRCKEGLIFLSQLVKLEIDNNGIPSLEADESLNDYRTLLFAGQSLDTIPAPEYGETGAIV